MMEEAPSSMEEAHFFPLTGSGEATISLYSWEHREVKALFSSTVSLVLGIKHSKVTCLRL